MTQAARRRFRRTHAPRGADGRRGRAHGDDPAALLHSAQTALTLAGKALRLADAGDLADRLDTVRISLDTLVGHGPAGPADLLPPARSTPGAGAMVADQALTAFLDAVLVADSDQALAYRHALAETAARRLPDVSPQAGRLLACLLRRPGAFIPLPALTRAIGTRTRSTGVIKVYVSKLRKALHGIGIDNAVLTGPASYAVDHDAAAAILKQLLQW